MADQKEKNQKPTVKATNTCTIAKCHLGSSSSVWGPPCEGPPKVRPYLPAEEHLVKVADDELVIENSDGEEEIYFVSPPIERSRPVYRWMTEQEIEEKYSNQKE